MVLSSLLLRCSHVWVSTRYISTCSFCFHDLFTNWCIPTPILRQIDNPSIRFITFAGPRTSILTVLEKLVLQGGEVYTSRSYGRSFSSRRKLETRVSHLPLELKWAVPRLLLFFRCWDYEPTFALRSSILSLCHAGSANFIPSRIYVDSKGLLDTVMHFIHSISTTSHNLFLLLY